MSIAFDFDQVLDRTRLSTAKWEGEIARTGRHDLLAFGTADMDFQSPAPIVEALKECAARGHFGYPHKGAGYYQSIVDYFSRRFSWTVEKDWILSATGIYASLQPILDELTAPGDEVIFQTPVHHIFREVVVAMGRVPVENPLKSNGQQYAMDLADLESKISPKTKVLLLCSPHNPMGRVWTAEELRALHEICFKNRIIVVTDEVYSGLLYPARRSPRWHLFLRRHRRTQSR
ncbi:hypothetical protein AWV80_41140 [Cupriavidus sp. UYMU48A]|nr:hypothetical protein AWV80_41140 [Cupriavidus sp. UYMU48A]